MTEKHRPIVVVGAGPAGLAAAIAAAAQHARVTVCEQLPRPGAKLLATGGGRCNITNVLEPEALARRFGRQWRFLLPALNALPPDGLRAWLGELGVPTTAGADGFHVFPNSGRALDVLEALLREATRLGVKIVTSCPVTELELDADHRVTGVRTGAGTLPADRVIVAAGGKGYPELGGRGLGYVLAEQAGHEIVTPAPAMVGLRTAEGWPGEAAGNVLPDVEVILDLPRHRGSAGRGELLFTHHGFSGPAILDLSGEVAALLASQPEVPLKINFFARRDAAFWQAEFIRWQQRHGKRQLVTLLAEHLPHRVAELLCRAARVDGAARAAVFDAGGRERLAGALTALAVRATATDGWGKAMVTRGGVALRKVDPDTLASRLAAGLHFAGEVLDLDGPCGGYNLQWAFSSGKLAGQAAAV